MDVLAAADERSRGGRQNRVVPIPRRWDQPSGLSPGGRWLKSPDTGESAYTP